MILYSLAISCIAYRTKAIPSARRPTPSLEEPRNQIVYFTKFCVLRLTARNTWNQFIMKLHFSFLYIYLEEREGDRT